MKKAKTIREYIYRNQLRKSAHFRYFNGHITFNHEGEWLSIDKFNQLYPKYEYKADKGKGENHNTQLLN